MARYPNFGIAQEGAGGLAPTITAPAAVVGIADASVGPLTWTVDDAETAAGQLLVAASSSNLELLPTAGIALGGTGTQRTVTLTPADGRTGTATVTLSVSDGTNTTAASFSFTVVAGSNPAPTVSLTAPVPAATVPEGLPVNLAANAADANGTVARVDFLINGIEVRAIPPPPSPPHGRRGSPAPIRQRPGRRTIRAPRPLPVRSPSRSCPTRPPPSCRRQPSAKRARPRAPCSSRPLGPTMPGPTCSSIAGQRPGAPAGAIAFADNGSNAARQTTATVTRAGSYTLQVTVADEQGETVSSTVTAVVEPVITNITLTPLTAEVEMTRQVTFAAQARDQFNSPYPVTWSADSGGTINSQGVFIAGTVAGTYLVRASAGGASTTATVTIPDGAVLSPVADATVAAAPLQAVNFGSDTVLRVAQPGATLVADYRFDGNLQSSVAGAPDLVYPSPAMAQGTSSAPLDWSVAGEASGPGRTGFRLAVGSLLGGVGNRYTVALRAKLPDPSGWKGLVYGSPNSRNNDDGFQVVNGKLAFWNA